MSIFFAVLYLHKTLWLVLKKIYELVEPRTIGTVTIDQSSLVPRWFELGLRFGTGLLHLLIDADTLIHIELGRLVSNCDTVAPVVAI